MSNESSPLTHAGTPAPSSDAPETDPHTELARQRAASADAWRGYVETGIVLHRQRAQYLEERNRELEAALHSATENESRAAQQAAHLAAENQRLEVEVMRLGARQEKSLRELIKRRVRGTAAGRVLYTIVQYLRMLLPPGGPDRPEIIIPNEPPVSDAPTPLIQLKPDSDTARRKVLLVTTHAEDSPAARFVLDLADSLQSDADVLVWHMGEGPLLSEFKERAAGFMEHGGNRYDYALARHRVRELLAHVGQIRYAITVGKETRSVLPALSAAYIPSIALLHEPEAYATSVYVYQEILYWAGHTCFTTPSALEQARRVCGDLHPPIASALTPGPGPRSLPRLEADCPHHAALRHRLGLDDAPAAYTVILGWGALNYQNGVDLFVACADQMIRQNPEAHYRFAWLAQQDTTAGDPSYGVQIQRQINALGLQDHVVLVHEPISHSVPVGLADLILLTARDEVPQHNGPEAVRQGIPVLAFEGNTMLARHLHEHGLAKACLLRAGDAAAMAARAAGLLRDTAQREALAERLRSTDLQGLGIAAYAQALMQKGEELAAHCAQEQLDEETITQSGQLRPAYMGDLVLQAEHFECRPERLYVLGWKTRIGARKPRPGILPSLYAQMALPADSREDAFAHYLRAGCPQGPWEYPVVAPAAEVPLPGPDFRVALHIHAYYPDMLVEMLERLGHNRCRPDLFISVKDAACQAEAGRILKAYEGKVQAIEIVPNRGRDVGPFLTTFGTALVRGYDLIGHLHTKRSEHAGRDAVEKWRNFLMANTLGGPESGPMLDNIVCRMAENPDWGVLFPDEPTPFGWDANREVAKSLAERMDVLDLPDHFCFPAGNMFWIRAAALRPFVELGLDYDDYPIEPLPIDGTLLHALERLFGVIPRSLGMECALSTVPGLSR